MPKKILTLDDLVQFCETQKLYSFNAKEYGQQLCVTVPAKFEKYEQSEQMLYCDIALMHTGRNRNRSSLTEKAAKGCLKTLPYKPVLANFADFDGELDFTSHDFYIDEDGEYVYIEKQVGCFTSDRATLDEEPDEDGRKYIHARVAIPRDYTKAADIIERKNGTKVSAELIVNEMSYSSEDKLLLLESVEVSGVTLLGRDPESGEVVSEGMENARLDIADFSTERNSTFSHKELIESLDKLTEQLANFNNNPVNNGECKEGGYLVNKFEELLKKYNKNAEDVTFEYENLADDELEAKFAEVFGDPTSGQNFEGEEGEDPTGAEPSEPTDPVVEPTGEDPTPPTDQEVADGVAATISALTNDSSTEDIATARAAYDALTETQKTLVSSDVVAALETQEARIAAAADQEAADAVTEMIEALTDESEPDAVAAARVAYDALTEDQKELVSSDVLEALEAQETRIANEPSNDDKPKKKKYSVVRGEDTFDFAVSISEVLSAISDLVNATYSESDNDWYMVDVYESEKSVVFVGCWTGAAYKQSYKVRNDVYSLVGDRVPVKCCYLTSDEEAELDKMRSNYSSIESKLAKYEAEPEKIAVLESDDYASIRESEEFAALREEKNHFDLSVDEVKGKLDEILLTYAKAGKIEFASDSKKRYPNMKKLFANNKNNKSSRYGNLFAKK